MPYFAVDSIQTEEVIFDFNIKHVKVKRCLDGWFEFTFEFSQILVTPFYGLDGLYLNEYEFEQWDNAGVCNDHIFLVMQVAEINCDLKKYLFHSFISHFSQATRDKWSFKWLS